MSSAPALAAIDIGQDFGEGISNAWSSIASFVPKFVGFLIILLVGWIIAKALSKLVDKVLERVGFDRVVERGGIKRMLARSNYDASDIIAKLVYYAILLIALQMAFGVFGPNPVSALLTAIVAWLPRAVVAVVIIVVAGAIAKAVRDLVTNALGGLSYGPLVGTMASVFIWGLAIIAALNQIGVATAVTLPVLITVLATIGGIAIIGVGGGLVRPMQSRWDKWLNRAEREVPQAKAANDAYQRGREDAARSGAPTASEATTPPRGQRTSVRAGQATRPGTAPGTATPGGPGMPNTGGTTGPAGPAGTAGPAGPTGPTGPMPPPPEQPPHTR